MAHRRRPAVVAVTAVAAAALLAAGALCGCGSSGAGGSSSASVTSAATTSSRTVAATSSHTASLPAPTSLPHVSTASSRRSSTASSVSLSPLAQAAADAPISPVINVAPSLTPTGIPAPADEVAVIRRWSDALRSGNVDAAARYFQIPSELINGPNSQHQFTEEQIATEAQAVQANTLLPCGAKLVSTDLRGEWVNALFILTSRPGPGGGCGDTRTTSRVNFLIHAGKIVDWLIAPPQAGDSAALSSTTTTTTATRQTKITA